MDVEVALQNLIVAARDFKGTAEQHEVLAMSAKVIKDLLESHKETEQKE